jgi:glycosyltransferase involved in cell wall biosynthesis
MQTPRRRRRGQSGRAGRAYVEQGFDLEKLNDQLIDLYRMLAAH